MTTVTTRPSGVVAPVLGAGVVTAVSLVIGLDSLVLLATAFSGGYVLAASP